MTTFFAVAVGTRFGTFARPKVGHSDGKIAANITNLADRSAVRIHISRFDHCNETVFVGCGAVPHPTALCRGLARDAISRSFPNLVQDLCRKCSFILRQKAAVMLLHDIGRVLDCVACLLIRPRLL